MIHIVKIASALALLQMLGSCSDTFVIVPAQDISANLGFKKPNVLGYSKYIPCVRWLAVNDLTDGKDRVWTIRPVRSNCLPLEEVEIGVAPMNFNSVGRPPAAGHKIRVVAMDDRNRYGLSREFIVKYRTQGGTISR